MKRSQARNKFTAGSVFQILPSYRHEPYLQSTVYCKINEAFFLSFDENLEFFDVFKIVLTPFFFAKHCLENAVDDSSPDGHGIPY